MVNQIHKQVIEYAYTYFYVNLYNFLLSKIPSIPYILYKCMIDKS